MLDKNIIGSFLLILLLLPAAFGPGVSSANDNSTRETLIICYNYGCKKTAQIQISQDQLRHIKSLFLPSAHSAAEERKQIVQAVGLLEYISGQQSPTHRDKALNPTEAEWPGQLDCIDESKNTTTYLRFLEGSGLFRWHKVLTRVRRRSFIFQHWTGRILDINNNQGYAVDSWYFDNGHPPYTQKIKDWKRFRRFKKPPIEYLQRSAQL